MERIFYQSDTQDAYTGLPIYVFDTSFLPSPDLINYDEFIPTLMSVLPQSKYVLVMLSCGLNKISWIWGIKFLKTFLSADNQINNLNNLSKIITVHDSWFVKSITQILTNYNITKKNLSSLNKIFENFTSIQNIGDSFAQVQNHSSSFLMIPPSLVVNCSTLSQLTYYVDIRKLKLSLNVYKHDLLLEPSISFQFPIEKIITPNTKIDQKQCPVFFHHFYQIFHIISLFGDRVELIFHKPGNKANTDILYQCVSRNQLIWINDWDLYCISTTFKKILMDLPLPLISCDDIPLPIINDFENTLESFNRLMGSYNKHETGYGMVLYQLLDLCHRIIKNNSTTKHTSASMAKCLGYCFSQELISSQNKDRVLVVTRIFKNFLDFWSQIKPLYQDRFPSISQIIKGEQLMVNKLDDSYDLSYDITMEEENDDDGDDSEENSDEARESREAKPVFNTNNILSNNQNLINQLQLQQSNNSNKSVEASSDSAAINSETNKLPPPNSSSEATGPPSTIDSSSDNSATQQPARNLQRKPSVTATSNFQFPPQKYKLDKPQPVHKKPSMSSLSSNYSSSSSMMSVNGTSSSASVRTYNSSMSGITLASQQQQQSKPQHHGSKPSYVSHSSSPSLGGKKPVIRGRKVGELAKLYEERCQGLELLNSM